MGPDYNLHTILQSVQKCWSIKITLAVSYTAQMKMQYNNARHRKTPINHYLTYICSSYGSVTDILPSSRALRLDVCVWACACMYTYTYVCVCVCMGARVHVYVSLMDEWSLRRARDMESVGCTVMAI